MCRDAGESFARTKPRVVRGDVANLFTSNSVLLVVKNVRAARVIRDSVSKSFKEVTVAGTNWSPTMKVTSCRQKACDRNISQPPGG
jgi:hypothetical protein